MPIHPTTMTKWRNRPGKSGSEKLLIETIKAGLKSKNKLYSLHAPEVECISKGKAHKPYEFGVKASIAVTNKEGFVIGAQSCPGLSWT